MLIAFIAWGLHVSCYGFYPICFVEISIKKNVEQNSSNVKCSMNSIGISE